MPLPGDPDVFPGGPPLADDPAPPARAGAGRERERFVRALVFVALLGALAVVPVCALLLRHR